jgi:hypothetical protein
LSFEVTPNTNDLSELSNDGNHITSILPLLVLIEEQSAEDHYSLDDQERKAKDATAQQKA